MTDIFLFVTKSESYLKLCVDKKGASVYLLFSRHGNGLSLTRGEEISPKRQKEVDRVAKREHKPLSFLQKLHTARNNVAKTNFGGLKKSC